MYVVLVNESSFHMQV